ncbi:MAG: hypothetical protein HKN90_02060 [Flavobacteriaceae bacterium]|nr:hypothetical protein [Flavobacteriaceae bacterium]
MKTFKILATLCLAIILISCDESENILVDVNESELIGTWNMTKLSQDGTVSVSGIPVPFTSEGSNFDSLIEITENPNDFAAKGSFTNTTTINNPVGSDIVNEERISLSELFTKGSWTVQNGIITVTQGSINQTIDILEFDLNMMTLEFEIDIPIDYDGVTLVSNSTVNITLVK